MSTPAKKGHGSLVKISCHADYAVRHDVLKCSSQPRRPPFCMHDINDHLLGYAARNYATLSHIQTKSVRMVITTRSPKTRIVGATQRH